MKIIKIGRASTNDIIINNDPSVSRIHCQIILDDNGVFRVIDLNSSNGTYINGVRRTEMTLTKSDIVRIGNTTLPWVSYFSSGHDSGRTNVGETNLSGSHSPYIPTPNPTPNPPFAKPDSFLVWSILCTICCCLPFGIVSIVQGSKVDGLWAAGDYVGAQQAARKAKTWFWWGVGIGLFSSLITFIYYFITGFALAAFA